MSAYKELVRRYCPKDVCKRVCNCGEAYETLLPTGNWMCESGCQANIYRTRETVAQGVLNELAKEKT